jgi:hypothetical protein
MFTHSNQIFAVVGSAYVSENHSDELHRYLPAPEAQGINFDDILSKLRSALSCHRRKDQ